jgi:hypothetical protein
MWLTTDSTYPHLATTNCCIALFAYQSSTILPFGVLLVGTCHVSEFSNTSLTLVFYIYHSQMSSTNRPYVFFVQGHIFSSPNSSTIPLIPPQNPISSEDMQLPKEFTKTRWADPRYPGFPFIPLCPRFTTEPFTCLRPPRDHFPIERSKSAWMLAPATVKCFQIIENDLRLIKRTLRLTVESPITLPSSWER